MNIGETDVLAHLRAGADSVEEHRFDADAVLAGSRRALRRRRSWQAAGACTTAAGVAFSLTLAGPVPVPRVGDVTLPGSEQVRELFGLADADVCEVPAPTMRRSPVEPTTSLRPGVTFNGADARPMSGCFDVRLDGHFTHAGINPSTLTEDGTFWSTPAKDGASDYFRRFDPLSDGSGNEMAAPASAALNDAEYMVNNLTTQGGETAWFEITTESTDQHPTRVFLAAGGSRTDPVTGEYYKSRSITEIQNDYSGILAVTGQRVAWHQEDTSAGSTDSGSTADQWGMLAWVAPIESGEPEVLAEHATAIGGDDDEIVVAALDQQANDVWTTTFTSFGDDGTDTAVMTLEHPSGTYVPLVDITDNVLTYALDGGYHLAVVPRVNGIADGRTAETIAVRLGNNGVDSLSAAGDAVTWMSGSVAYLLRDAAPGGSTRSDLVRIGQGGLREQMMVSIAGDRIAWGTTDEDYATGQIDRTGMRVNVGTLLESEARDANTHTVPKEPEPGGRAVPAAPTVTVPENAKFPTYD